VARALKSLVEAGACRMRARRMENAWGRRLVAYGSGSELGMVGCS
jgi:hypothetical protein